MVPHSPWIWPNWEATSLTVEAGLTFERERGVNGGEATSSALCGTWGEPKNFATCIAIALWPLEGMEKLRGTTNGGVGSGDATLDASKGILFIAESSWFLKDKGAEWPIKSGDFAGLGAKLPGGLGSSWSSLILGEETRGGEALGDTLGDEEGWGIGNRENIPETNWGNSVDAMGPLADKAGFVDPGLLINGPEKACRLNFLVSEALNVSCCRSESPSAKGGGSGVEVSLLSLSLTVDCGFEIPGPDKLPLPECFSCFLSSNGEECHKLWVTPLGLERGTELLVLDELECLASIGVGSTYVLDFRVDDGCIFLIFSAGSNFFSANIGAEWLPTLGSLPETLRSSWFLSTFIYTRKFKTWILEAEKLTFMNSKHKTLLVDT